MNQSNIYEYLIDKKVVQPLLLLTKNDKDSVAVADVARILDFAVYNLPDIRISLGEDLRAIFINFLLLSEIISTHLKKRF